MATLLIRNLDDSVKSALRIRAARNGRSMEEEARLILINQTRSVPAGKGLGSRLLEIGKLAEGHELALPPRSELPRKPPFLSDEEWNDK